MPSLFIKYRILLVAVAAAVSGCASPSKPASVADTISTNSQLSTLSSLVAKAGLTDTLKGHGPFTVFAPTNEAFAKIPAKTIESITADPVKLKAILTYHVLPGKVMAADVKNGNVKTVNGANVALSKAGEFVTIEDALVQTADISATNGVVHIVDSVLIPPAQ